MGLVCGIQGTAVFQGPWSVIVRDRGCLLRALGIPGGSAGQVSLGIGNRLGSWTAMWGKGWEAFRMDEAHSSTWRTGDGVGLSLTHWEALGYQS